jgi:hypothetical protein
MYCPSCGAQITDGTVSCGSCGWRDFVRTPSVSKDPTMRMLLPVGRSPYAIVAGYLGLISPILLPAPFALIFGLLALYDIKKHPDLGGKGRANLGVMMGSSFSLLLFALIAFWVAVVFSP